MVSNNIEDREDLELIDRFLRGEERCFDMLYRKHEKWVLRLCCGWLGDYHDGKEVWNDIFLKVHDCLKDFKKESKFSTWLYRIAVNSCKNKLRARKRRRKKEPYSLDETIETEEGEMKRQIADERPTPDYVKSKIYTEALDSLKDIHRDILILRELEYGYEKIADTLNIPLGTVRSRLSRAREEFEKELNERGFFDDL